MSSAAEAAAPALESAFMTGFEGLLESRPQLPDWLEPRRRAAEEVFRALGLPTRRQEAWRLTSLRTLSETAFSACEASGSPAGGEDLRSLDLGHAHRLVTVNGRHAAQAAGGPDLPDGTIVCSLAEAMQSHTELVAEHLGRLAGCENDAIAALATAMLTDGAFVFIPDGVEVEQPIHLLFLSEAAPGRPTARFPRTLVVAGARSRGVIVESHAGAGGPYLSVPVAEIVVGPGAVLDHSRLQDEGDRAFHLAIQQAELARGSRLTSHSMAVGSALARCDIGAVLAGEDSTCDLGGLSLTRGTQHVDTQVLVDHRQPHGRSRQLFKGVLDDSSRTVFNGRIVVRQHAQKTDARQSNRNLLLSRSSIANSNPQLEILADDVRCTHGSTVGELDRDALFYLRARGIPETEARGILTRAFAGEVLEGFSVPAVRRWAEAEVERRLTFSPPLREAV